LIQASHTHNLADIEKYLSQSPKRYISKYTDPHARRFHVPIPVDMTLPVIEEGNGVIFGIGEVDVHQYEQSSSTIKQPPNLDLPFLLLDVRDIESFNSW